MGSNKLDLQKRQHRERGQLGHRKKLGLLEKHKDYVLRARDYHAKQERLKKLALKASARNKDEFYYGMIKGKTKGGVHIGSRGNSSLPIDLVKILKSQDAGYVRVLAATEEKKINRLREELNTHLSSEDRTQNDSDIDTEFGFSSGKQTVKRKRIVFADTEDEVKSLAKRARKEQAPKPPSKTKPSTEFEDDFSSNEDEAGSVPADLDTVTFPSIQAELEARQSRLSSLKRALREMEMQQALMGRGSRKEVVHAKEKGTRTEDEDPEEVFNSKGKSKVVPKPLEKGMATGARVWKWKSVRRK
ncbi:small-subunit processome [Atractiella rhizophila]|nr:small-subunit processome [Atractiella rhizophila]